MANLDWLEGTWIGTHGADEVEEQWTAERYGQRHGLFRWFRNGQTLISEWMVIGDFDGKTELRIRHMRSDGASIEDRDTCTRFALERLEDGRAEFRHLGAQGGSLLIYERKDKAMTVWFESESGAVPVEGQFKFQLREP
ncbi:MAG: hypothetical protein JST40_05845 [Armatimonadetes bacterium]|nr:hypothetical protein [Armatimonadota bacterium]